MSTNAMYQCHGDVDERFRSDCGVVIYVTRHSKILSLCAVSLLSVCQNIIQELLSYERHARCHNPMLQKLEEGHSSIRLFTTRTVYAAKPDRTVRAIRGKEDFKTSILMTDISLGRLDLGPAELATTARVPYINKTSGFNSTTRHT